MPSALPPDHWGYCEVLEEDTPEFRKYHETAVGALKEVLDIVDSESWQKKDGWKLEASHSELPFKVYSKSGVQKKGKTFMGTAEIKVPMDVMWADLIDGLDAIPSWNKDVVEYGRLFKVGRQCDVTYNCFRDMGPISSRDFVNARCWRILADGRRAMASANTKTALKKDVKGRVRGEDSPSLALAEDLGDGRILYTFSSNTDLKGFLPKMLTDSVMHQTIMDYFVYFNAHLTGQSS